MHYVYIADELRGFFLRIVQIARILMTRLVYNYFLVKGCNLFVFCGHFLLVFVILSLFALILLPVTQCKRWRLHSGRRVVTLSKTYLLPKSAGNTQEAAAPSQYD